MAKADDPEIELPRTLDDKKREDQQAEGSVSAPNTPGDAGSEPGQDRPAGGASQTPDR
jgi:hypothetical protein